MTTAPSVSVVIATYNRPQVLRYSIASVLRSDFSDFEIVVVGDGCTDNTEEIVCGFSDPRIRYMNLPTNSGFQSVPNNKGIELARGRYLTFLNHDDLYFADRISSSVSFLEREGADIVWCPVLVLTESGRESGPPDPACDIIELDGAGYRDRYDPRSFVIASSWTVRTDVCRSVGPWRTPDMTRLSPSQEWLYRAHRQGRRLSYHPHPSVLCIHAGARRGAYLRAQSPDHERAWRWIVNDDRPRLLECAAASAAHSAAIKAEARGAGIRRLLRHLRRLILDVFDRAGIHPVAMSRFLRGQGKGAWSARQTQIATEAPELAEHDAVECGETRAERYLANGWHTAEAGGRWTSSRHAELMFRVTAETAARCDFEISGRPARAMTVTFALNDAPALAVDFAGGEGKTVRLPLPGHGIFWLSIDVAALDRQGDGQDAREVGFWLSRIAIVARRQSTGPSGD